MHLYPTSAVRDLARTVQLVFFRGGYVGACVVEDEILSLAWVLPAQSVRTVGSAWKEQRDFLARQSSRIGDLLFDARAMIDRPVAVASNHRIGKLLETPLMCGVSIAAAKLMPSLVRSVAAATRLRGFDDAALQAAVLPPYREDARKSTATK